MKSYTSTVGCVALLVGLAACGNNKSGPAGDGGTADRGQVFDGSVSDTTVDLTVDFFSPGDASSDGPAADGPVADSGVPDAPSPDGGNNNDVCTGATQLTWTGAPIVVQVDTTGASDDIDVPAGTCDLSDGSPGPDKFFVVTVPAGQYTVRLEGLFDPALYVLSTCSPTACIAGSDIPSPAETEEVMLTATGPSTKYIIGVDSYDSSEFGPTTLTIFENTMPPADAGVGDAAPVDAGVPDVGVDAPVADVGSADSAAPDAGTADAPQTASIVITEFLANPTSLDDNTEWFEVYNAGTAAVDMQGWTIKDDDSDSHVIASSVVVAPGSYVVFGVTTNTAINGDVNVAYAYGSDIVLANSGDEIVLLDGSQNEVDRIVWSTSSGWNIFNGSSLSLGNPTLDNLVQSNWCKENNPWSGSAVSNGTPGAAAGCTP